MIPLTPAEIATTVGGTLHDVPEPDAPVVTGEATLDSRAVERGGLFVALEGERADGHDFARTAVEAGAALVLGSRPTGVPTVVVDDVVEALGRLTASVLAALPDVLVLAMTGSQGKTSTKDLLAQVLAAHGPTIATRGNLNNELGVPLTALRATPATRFLVLEMGARGVGHLAYLCSFARPRVGAVLNVGTAHLGEFGTQADIARAKGELVESLPPDGVAVLNADDPLVAAMASRTPAPVLRFGTGDGADLQVRDLRTDDLGRARFDLAEGEEVRSVSLRIVGEHQAANAAAAAAMARAAGLPLASVAEALCAAGPGSPWRMQLHEVGDVVVVNDAYNANPASMRAALHTLAGIGAARPSARTVAVLGVMRELGPDSEAEHESLGEHVMALGIDRLLVVGAEAAGITRGALRHLEGAARTAQVGDRDEAARWVRDNVAAHDVVLVKASRGAALERVADALVTHLEENR
ncbi:MAG: UDP-N-acetylmuramoyl-tripeptide--D-alanyl-D-alanine ligase [Nocardioides sp.]|nr:UDP-N-acetylmuramoyl-tripeptide--D-alanyl-D-alanine ligase [Nocardioides sp.]